MWPEIPRLLSALHETSLTDSLSYGFMSHQTQNRSFQRLACRNCTPDASLGNLEAPTQHREGFTSQNQKVPVATAEQAKEAVRRRQKLNWHRSRQTTRKQ